MANLSDLWRYYTRIWMATVGIPLRRVTIRRNWYRHRPWKPFINDGEKTAVMVAEAARLSALEEQELLRLPTQLCCITWVT